jgi:hypothetical protein
MSEPTRRAARRSDRRVVHRPARRSAPRAALAAFAVAAAVALSLPACRGDDWRVSQLYGGATSMDVLTHAQSVEAFRLDPEARPAEGAPRLGDFAVTAGPVAVPPADVAELTAVLRDPDTYDWLRAKACEFTPGVGVRLVKDASRVEIALCFSCDELMIFRRGSRIGVEDFDSARPRLVALAKRWFPDDARIQALE